MQTSIQISQEEYRSRADRLLEEVGRRALSGVVLFDRDYILYYTGFAFIPTERPIAFVMNAEGERGLFVPRLETEHAKANAMIDRVAHYLEYPYMPHPMEAFQEMLKEMSIRGVVGADHDGYPWILGYRGKSLTEMLGQPPAYLAAVIEDQMMMESVKWGHLAHMLLQRYTKVGTTESEVSGRASLEATLTMLDTIGPIYRAQSYFSDGAGAGYRGQIGRNAAIPHALANNIVFQAGDVLVTGAGAPMWGYNSELERTMFIGKPSPDQKKFFDHMVALQNTAFEALGPGISCSEVDKQARAYYDKHNLWDYWKHHVGHAIGLRYHESPFLDLGDETVMQPGMVFTIEPGLYHPELGGFRHSDTVLITSNGIEILTYYPRDLESLIIPV